MGLLTKEVEITLHNKIIKHYEELGYLIPKLKGKWGITVSRGTKILVKTEDLTNGSAVKVDIECDGCGKILENIKWIDYKKCVKEDGKYYCLKCAINLYAGNNTVKTKLKKGKSFEQWCIENNRQDILDRWDYEINKFKPNEIGHGSNKKIYLKCPTLKHKSELKGIQGFVGGNKGSLSCNACNSFAQWGIDNIGKDFLEKYWDYNKNTVDPWKIPSHWNKKVWIKCQEKFYHNSYDVKCNGFTSVNSRCPYCHKNSGKVHQLDSLGKLLEDKNMLSIWADKNKKSPYEYAPNTSNKEVWWKCSEGKHQDYKRTIASSNFCEFRCPECQYSKGEEIISYYLINKNWLKISQNEYSKLINKGENKYYIPQKEFDGLLGLGGRNLSYDFYIPKFNLLIEFQGLQHEKYCKGFHKSKSIFERQQEHDRRKKEYALQNEYNFLEIWYWDFDNIEAVLDEYLSKLEIVKL